MQLRLPSSIGIRRRVTHPLQLAPSTHGLQRRPGTGQDRKVRPIRRWIQRFEPLDFLHNNLDLRSSIIRHPQHLHPALPYRVESLPPTTPGRCDPGMVDADGVISL